MSVLKQFLSWWSCRVIVFSHCKGNWSRGLNKERSCYWLEELQNILSRNNKQYLTWTTGGGFFEKEAKPQLNSSFKMLPEVLQQLIAQLILMVLNFQIFFLYSEKLRHVCVRSDAVNISQHSAGNPSVLLRSVSPQHPSSGSSESLLKPARLNSGSWTLAAMAVKSLNFLLWHQIVTNKSTRVLLPPPQAAPNDWHNHS